MFSESYYGICYIVYFAAVNCQCLYKMLSVTLRYICLRNLLISNNDFDLLFCVWLCFSMSCFSLLTLCAHVQLIVLLFCSNTYGYGNGYILRLQKRKGFWYIWSVRSNWCCCIRSKVSSCVLSFCTLFSHLCSLKLLIALVKCLFCCSELSVFLYRLQ